MNKYGLVCMRNEESEKAFLVKVRDEEESCHKQKCALETENETRADSFLGLMEKL
jgi:hypothetical protein